MSLARSTKAPAFFAKIRLTLCQRAWNRLRFHCYEKSVLGQLQSFIDVRYAPKAVVHRVYYVPKAPSGRLIQQV